MVAIKPKLKGMAAAHEMCRCLTGELAYALKSTSFSVAKAGIEGQQDRDTSSGVRTENLLMLALVSGAALAVCEYLKIPKVHLLDPATWTKGHPKELRHNRLRQMHYNMSDEGFAVRFGFKKAQAFDVWDAVDMARYVNALR